MDTLGKKLKKLRKQKKWTLEEVAGKLGLRGHSTYSNWEYDRREPDLETITRLAEIYGVDSKYLMPDSSKIQKVIQMQNTIMEGVEHISKENETDLRVVKEGYLDGNDMLINEIDLSDEELLSKHSFVYGDTKLDKEQSKEMIKFIRFLLMDK